MMKFKVTAVAVSLLLCSPAWAADLAVEKIAAQITARSASRNVFKIEDVHLRMQSAINCLVGPKGEGFDAAAPNPCAASGNGLIPDSDPAKKDAYMEVVAKLKTGIATPERAAAMQIALDAADAIVAISED